jgi:lysophosphatidylcholine acyltransferase/lyso-PAF acetyltransferase
MFNKQNITATLGKRNPLIRNDILTKPFARLFLLVRFFVFAGFWLLLIIFRFYLLAFLIAWLILAYKVLFSDFRTFKTRTYRKEQLREYKDLQGWRRLFLDLLLLFSARILMYFIGIYNVQRHYVTQYELHQLQNKIRINKPCEQEEIEPVQDHPPFLIVSNRVAAIDPIVITNEFGAVSLLCKRWIAGLPLIGDWARKISCIFSDDDIGGVMRVVNERATEYYKLLNDVENDFYAPRLVVFPEGTPTNGSQLIQFHKGPFSMGLPVQPVVLRYPFTHFNAAWLKSPSTFKYIVLVLSQMYQCVEVSK